ncbi:hypothetical protein WKI71_39950 [Streptomyces sp. MS1.AVA.1]|uniref:Secreted protein n=1 Tax=Streptomyces machairae TaxID=3134109 RepID=A0ABU8UTR7_9ACTN
MGAVLGLVVRLGALRVVGPAGPAQRDADLQQPVERRAHAQRGGDPAPVADAAPAAGTGLAAPHGVQPYGAAVHVGEAFPAVVRDGLDGHLVADAGLLPAHEACPARGGEGAGLLGEQAQQFRLVELVAQFLRELPEDLLGNLLG